MRVFVFILLLCTCCSLVASEAERPRWCRATPCALIPPSFYLHRKCCSTNIPPNSSETNPPPPAVPKSPALTPSPEAHDFKAPWWCRYMPRLPCNTIRFEHGRISAKCCGPPAATLHQTPPSPADPVLHETPCPNHSPSDPPAAIFTPDPTMCFEQRITSTKCQVHKKSENSFKRSIRCCTDTTYIGKECSSPNNMTRTTKTQCTVDGVPVVPPSPSEPPVEAQPSPARPPSGTPPSESPVEAQPSPAHPPSGTPPSESPVEGQPSPSPVEAQPSPAPVEAHPSPAHPPSGTPPSESPVEAQPNPAPVEAQPSPSPPPPNSPPPPASNEGGHSDCYPPAIENQAAAINGMCCITRVVNGADCSGPVRKPYQTVHTDCHPSKNGFCFSG